MPNSRKIAKEIKEHFPILKRKINGKDLIYLDNAATTQKPQSVITALTDFYSNINANVHRGIHTLSEESTAEYEKARAKVAKFINAKYPEEIVFTRNATESINLVAQSWGLTNINNEDTILVTALEHHSNLVPWQELAHEKEATIKMLELDLNYEPIIELPYSTKILAITGMSNVLGVTPPLKEIIDVAHMEGIKVMVDAAQLIAHSKVDVQEMDCDFMAFSSHKMYGPTGVGVLYVKKEILEKMPPYQFGGGMIKIVNDDRATWADIPARFEAGTPNIADVIAMQKAIEFITEIGPENIAAHEKKLTHELVKRLQKYPEVNLHISKNENHYNSIVSFTMSIAHPHDIASIFSDEGIAIRAGHHCCQPLMRRMEVPATARISFGPYNTEEDLDKVEEAVKKVVKIFG